MLVLEIAMVLAIVIDVTLPGIVLRVQVTADTTTGTVAQPCNPVCLWAPSSPRGLALARNAPMRHTPNGELEQAKLGPRLVVCSWPLQGSDILCLDL